MFCREASSLVKEYSIFKNTNEANILLVYQKIAEHALNILINLTEDPVVLESVATDEKFLEMVFSHIVVSLTVLFVFILTCRSPQ